MIEIAIKNHSTIAPDSEITELVAALQIQVSSHFFSVWGVDAKLHFLPANAAVPHGWWQLGIFDNADQAGALGYHETTAQGLPLGKVFWGTTLEDGGLPSVTTSHELLEMLLDPYINLTAFDEAAGRAYAYEACDAVEADSFGYKIGNVVVSDFVTPAYFEPDDLVIPKTHKRSWRGHVTKPFELATGGYMSYFDFATKSWQQVDAMKAARHGHPTGRHGLRLRPANQRIPSTAE